MKKLLAIGFGMAMVAASLLAASHTLTLAGGDTARVSCSGDRLDVSVVNATTVDLSCVAPTPPPPPPPPPPPSSPSMVPLPTSDSADMRYWHAPKAHDGLNPHEHGDAPPDWVMAWSEKNLGSSQLFGWSAVATPNENYMKHQAYKGAKAKISNVQVYILHHSQPNPLAWAAPYHSFRMWVRDQQGGVSYVQGRMWFGWPDVRSHRLARYEEEPGYYGPSWPGRGQFILGCRALQDQATSEQWYGFMGERGPHMGLTIDGAAAFCNPNNILPMSQAMDMSLWDLTGSMGTNRRFELSWYMPKSSNIETPRYEGWWCYQVAPEEPAHDHYSTPYWRHYGPAEGPNLCRAGYAPQYMAPTMPLEGIYYRLGNTFTRRFSSEGLAQSQ